MVLPRYLVLIEPWLRREEQHKCGVYESVDVDDYFVRRVPGSVSGCVASHELQGAREPEKNDHGVVY